eukprot:SAG31_NODE_1865_length_7034_cov_1.932805_5_plen_125_part_00
MAQPGVVLETSMGQVTLELYWQHAPRTCRCGVAVVCAAVVREADEPACHHPPLIARVSQIKSSDIETAAECHYWLQLTLSVLLDGRNFFELTNRGYYNGVVFHRVIQDFMVGRCSSASKKVAAN